MTGSEDNHSSSLLRHALRIGGALLVLLVIGMIFSGYDYTHHRVAISPKENIDVLKREANPLGLLQKSTNIEPVTVEMGETTLRIPKNYFLIGPSTEDGHTSFALLVQLPNFDPRTPENQEIFNQLGWYDKVDIFIGTNQSPEPYTAKRSLDAFYPSSNHDLQVGINGYNVFTEYPDHSYEFYFQGNFDTPYNWTQCNASHLANEIPNHWSPSCQRWIALGSKLTMNYTLSRKYLADLNSIQPRLIDFLNGFVIDGPKLQVTE